MMAISGQIIKVWHVEVYTKELFCSSFTSLITSMINVDGNMMAISSQILKVWDVEVYTKEIFISCLTNSYHGHEYNSNQLYFRTK